MKPQIYKYPIFLLNILHKLYKSIVTNLVFQITKTIIKINILRCLAKKQGHKK